MLKTPQNLSVPLHTYRKRLIKELIFLGVLQRTSMEHREYGMFPATEGGALHTSSHRAQRLPHYQNG